MKRITNELSSSAKKSMLTRILTGIVLAIVCVPCLFLGSWFFFGLTVIITFLCAFEIVKVSSLKGLIKVLIFFVTIVFALGIVYYCLFSKNIDAIQSQGTKAFNNPDFLINAFSDINLSIMLITFMIAIYFLISFACEPFSIMYVFYFVTMLLVLAIGVQSFLFLRNSPFHFFEKALPVTEKSILTTNSFKYGREKYI